MSLSNREAFKFGFLLRCADENLSPEDTAQRIKSAAEHFSWDGRPVVTAQVVEQVLQAWEKNAWFGDALAKVRDTGLLGLGGAAALGAGGGYALANAVDSDKPDADQIKQQELLAAYQQQTQRIRRLMAARSYRPNKAPRKPRLVA